MISARQEIDLRPQLERLDRFILRAADVPSSVDLPRENFVRRAVLRLDHDGRGPPGK